ncbi:MAG: glycosyltransferase family 2 protein [Bacilli bacterium]
MLIRTVLMPVRSGRIFHIVESIRGMKGVENMSSVIDIVVVSYNTRDILLACLNSLRIYTPEDHRIIVVDNGSQDATVQAVRTLAWENLSIIANNDNYGYAKACNQGIAAGDSPFIILLNSDIIVTQGWLAPLLQCMQQDSRTAVVGPKLVDQRGRITGAGIVGTNANHWPRGYMEQDQPGKFDQEEDCISVCGAAYLIRRALISELGLFDENYFFYFEETDYSFQARSKGYRVVYCPHSRIYHLSGQSNGDHRQLRALFEQSERYFRSKWASTMGDF